MLRKTTDLGSSPIQNEQDELPKNKKQADDPTKSSTRSDVWTAQERDRMQKELDERMRSLMVRVKSHKDSIRRGLLIQPVKADCRCVAFHPERWISAGIDFEMLAWECDNVVFLTKKGEYDAVELSAFVSRLDDGWQIYSNLIGEQPRLNARLFGKPTICAILKRTLSCGYGCGFIGATGIEVAGFYAVDLPIFKQNPLSFEHYYFYEMGRNFFVFDDRHSLFKNGFSVFMRYVCMDCLECKDLDAQTRCTIESCEEIYVKSDIAFLHAFTELGSMKGNRLRDTNGCEMNPSDQPVMYATAMLKLRRDYGGNEWVQKFYHTLRQCKPAPPAKDAESARTQFFTWLVCASVATGQDLTCVFADRWRMPVTEKERQLMNQIDWSAADNSFVSKLTKSTDNFTNES